MTRPKFPDPATVYGLKSKRDGRVRFIGQTTDLPRRCYQQWLVKAKASRSGAVLDWIRAETAAGFVVIMSIIVEAGTVDETLRKVRARAADLGYDLLDQKIRARKRRRVGKLMSAETRAKIAAARRGTKHSVETKSKIKKALLASKRNRVGPVYYPMQRPALWREGLNLALADLAALM